MNNHADIEVRWWASMTPAFITACYFVFHWVEHRDDPSTLLAAIGTLAAGVVITGMFLFPRELRGKFPITQVRLPAVEEEVESPAEEESELVEALESFEVSLPPMVFDVRPKPEPPEDPNPWLEKGRALARGGHYRDALYCFSYVLQWDPTNQDALTAKGGCLLKMNRNDEALRAFMRAANVDGTSPLQKEGMVLFLKRLRAATEF
jgi:tetratricopeptide (TPR) repeat protein